MVLRQNLHANACFVCRLPWGVGAGRRAELDPMERSSRGSVVGSPVWKSPSVFGAQRLRLHNVFWSPLSDCDQPESGSRCMDAASPLHVEWMPR
jgi:hypothetical protein